MNPLKKAQEKPQSYKVFAEKNDDHLSRSDQRLVLPPFYADTAVPLYQPLDSGQLHPDTPLFVAELDKERTITLIARQMGVHPVAQGVLHGRPWLITF